MTVNEVTAKFGVSRGVVYYWIDRGVIEARRRNNGSPYWITLNPEKEEQLRTWVHDSSRIHNAQEQVQTRTVGGAE